MVLHPRKAGVVFLNCSSTLPPKEGSSKVARISKILQVVINSAAAPTQIYEDVCFCFLFACSFVVLLFRNPVLQILRLVMMDPIL